MSVKLDCFEGRQNFSDEDNFNPFNKSQIDWGFLYVFSRF
jgi:hypothetical protein